jgi:hypothetical protein
LLTGDEGQDKMEKEHVPQARRGDTMAEWYARYQQGLYQQVYDELLTMQDQVFAEPVYPEAVLVARTLMRRVRQNIEVLIPRLKALGYELVDGYWNRDCSALIPEELAQADERYRVFRAPPAETAFLLWEVEECVGTLPLCVKAWYEEVGSVNLIGTFPAIGTLDSLTETLDPLLIEPVEDLLDQFPASAPEEFEEFKDDDGLIEVSLAVDAPLKHGASGSGGYNIKTPCRAFDTTIDLIYYPKDYTFVEYLRSLMMSLHF